MDVSGLMLMAMAVKDNPCGDEDEDSAWKAIWTMPDGSTFTEDVAHPETERDTLRTAKQVKIYCPLCGSSWTITEVNDHIFTADVEVIGPVTP